VLKMWLR